jgi:1-acyl-sn-glycerol-3-phosphate acyltransferase
MLGSLLFLIGQVLATLIFAPLALLIFPLPLRQRYKIMTGWGRFVVWWLEKTCNITYEVEGLENIPSGAAIILSKHQSAFETVVFQKIFPIQVWLLKRELFFIPLFGWALASLEPIAINRNKRRQAMQELIEQGTERLSRGLSVVIYPEGTRVAPGKRERYRVGGALLAEKSGYPVVPVAINSGKFWARNSFIKKPGTIKIVIGPVIESKGKDYKEINELVEEWIEGQMLNL